MRRIYQWMLVLVICALAGEISLRLFGFLPLSSATYRYDPEIGYRLQPGVLEAAQGFNDHRGDQKVDALRILFIGDSFTFGTKAPELVFPALVERGLERRGEPAAVYNRGLPGAGTNTYLDLTEAYIRKLDPQIIVLTLYLGNDIEQSHPRQETRLYAGRLAILNRPFFFGFNLREFYTYHAIRSIYRAALFRVKGDDAPLPASAIRQGCTSGAFRPYEMYHVAYRELEPMQQTAPTDYIMAAYDGLRQRLHSFREMTQGRRVLILLAPSRIQVDPLWRDDVFSFWQLHTANYDFDRPNRFLAGYLTEMGLPFVDLSERMTQESATRSLYDCLDTHWNVDGNAVAAEAVLQWLELPASGKH